MPQLPRRALVLAALPALAPGPPADDAMAALLTLLARRLEIGRLVAEAKWNSGAAIADPAREALVVAAAEARAAAAGVDPAAVAALIRAQIEASKRLQAQLHAEWRATARPAFADVPDLAGVRGRLDRIGEALPTALAAALPLLPGSCARLDQEAATILAAFATPIRAEAVRPLRRWAGCG